MENGKFLLTEVNIDALVGPTYHYGGLGVGNLASQRHRNLACNPKRAALAGLDKVELVAGLGIPQYVWLPPPRPRMEFLTQLGFDGPPEEQIKAALEQAPEALSAAFSGAYLWAANSATTSPSVDAADNNYHITPANLVSSWHRASEPEERTVDLVSTLADLERCVLHSPLPAIVPLRDEGAANHMRLCDPTGRHGFNVFVYGADETSLSKHRFMPRQTRAAVEAIARVHRLNPDHTFFLQQHPRAIDEGVFHNDVIATSHRHLLIHHEYAYLDAEDELERLESAYTRCNANALLRLVISEQELSLPDAVQSYFFNSQLLSPPSERADALSPMILVCPQQCQRIPSAKKLIDRLLADPQIPIGEVHFVSLDESMAGGGGPACLRLRLMLEESLLHCLEPRLMASPQNLDAIRQVIEREYPEESQLSQFVEPAFVEQATVACERLRRSLLGSR